MFLEPKTFLRWHLPRGWAAVFLATFLLAIGVSAAPAHASSARSILVHFTNNSDTALTLRGSTNLDHGCWAGGSPPAQIAVGQSVDIEADSCGFMTGAEFHLDYNLSLSGAGMEMHYDNPWVGSNSYSEATPAGYAFGRSGGSGNNAELTVSFACDSKTCDGIPDDWKKNGVTIDPGGGNPSQFVNLPQMGVSLDRPNVLIQLDWMQDATHNQRLGQAAIDAVIKAYDQDPVTYPGATRSGITLIVDAGPTSTITPGGALWGALSQAKQITWAQDLLTGSRSAGYGLTTFYNLLKSNFVPTGRLPIFHYAITGAEIAPTGTAATCYKGDGTSGLTTSDKLGFMVTLGDWTSCVGSQNEQTGTFMHELGHDLGLQHGGLDGTNFKPNYPSVMNYLYQTTGVPRNGQLVFDYSRDNVPSLDETKLTESGGVNLGANPSTYGTGHICLSTGAGGATIMTAFTQQALAPVDFSCDNKTPNGGTGFDANGDGSQTTLAGSTSDWSRIQFKTGGVGAGSDAKDTVTIPSSGVSAPSDELTYDMALRIHFQATSTTTLTSSANPSSFGQTVTLTTKVAAQGSSPNTPTGAVQMFDGGTLIGSGNLSGGSFSVTTSTLSVGTHPITASYGADDNFLGSASSTLNQVVNKAATTTMVTSSANPSVFGQPVTYTATVAAQPPGGGTPTGTVQFFNGATPIGSGLLSNGIFSLPPTTPAVGTYHITATYSGDTNFLGSTSPVLNQVVNKAPTITSLAANPVGSAGFGHPVTFTAAVSVPPPGAGTPTGGVSFTVDGTTVAQGPLGPSLTASVTTSALSPGSHVIGASYGGDGNFLASDTTLNYLVTCTNVVGNRSGPLIASGDSTCVINGTVTGSIVVPRGTSLAVINSTVGGAITAGNSPNAIEICGSSVGGTINIVNATGLVIVGDPGDAACAVDTVTGTLLLRNNTNGVEAIGNTVGNLVVSGNSGPGPYPGDGTVISGNLIAH